jgi:hypothetical protein
MKQQDVISWISIISASVKQGNAKKIIFSNEKDCIVLIFGKILLDK